MQQRPPQYEITLDSIQEDSQEKDSHSAENDDLAEMGLEVLARPKLRPSFPEDDSDEEKENSENAHSEEKQQELKTPSILTLQKLLDDESSNLSPTETDNAATRGSSTLTVIDELNSRSSSFAAPSHSVSLSTSASPSPSNSVQYPSSQNLRGSHDTLPERATPPERKKRDSKCRRWCRLFFHLQEEEVTATPPHNSKGISTIPPHTTVKLPG